MSWLNDLKCAYLNKNDNKIMELLSAAKTTLPTLKTRDEMLEILAILEQLADYAKTQKEELGAHMKKLKQQRNFFSSVETSPRLSVAL